MTFAGRFVTVCDFPLVHGAIVLLAVERRSVGYMIYDCYMKCKRKWEPWAPGRTCKNKQQSQKPGHGVVSLFDRGFCERSIYICETWSHDLKTLFLQRGPPKWEPMPLQKTWTQWSEATYTRPWSSAAIAVGDWNQKPKAVADSGFVGELHKKSPSLLKIWTRSLPQSATKSRSCRSTHIPIGPRREPGFIGSKNDVQSFGMKWWNMPCSSKTWIRWLSLSLTAI